MIPLICFFFAVLEELIKLYVSALVVLYWSGDGTMDKMLAFDDPRSIQVALDKSVGLMNKCTGLHSVGLQIMIVFIVD